MPMIPDARAVLIARYMLQAFMRVMGLILALLSVVPILSWFAEGLSDGDLLELGYYYPRIVAAGVLLGGGLLLLFANGLLARWLTPVPKQTRCPRCNYLLRGLVAPTCPECGLALPEAFVDTQTDR